MKNIKVILSILLVVFSISVFRVDVSAASNITIYVDDVEQSYSSKAVVQNGTTLVPLRGIFEALGAEVQWNQASQSIDASKGSKKVWLQLGSKEAKVDGKTVTLTVPAQAVNGSTLVPIRFISESLGAKVEWDQATQSVRISQGSVSLGDLKVHFIDVGQGDSILIQSPNNETMLIDGGPKSAGDDVVAFLKSQNVTDLDYVVATHPDADHIGGLIDVFEAYKVNNFVNSGKVHTTETYEELLTAVSTEGAKDIEVTIGQTINLDSLLKVQVLHTDSVAEENNDASIVLKVTYNQVSFLLTGDADVELEEGIASKYDVKSTILKAGHHGSDTSSSLEFLQKVKPAATILSHSEDNSYGHPHSTVLNNLKSVGSKAYSTAQDGTITVSTNGVMYSISANEFNGEIDVYPLPQPEEEKPSGDVNSGTYVIPDAPTDFKNCTLLREYYPKGVKKGHPAYKESSDRDKDGWACEA